MKVLLAVTGGIAAYKAVELLRELQRRGCEVQVLMTPGAEEFVRPLTFAALSNHPVLTSLWTPTLSPEQAGLGEEEFGIEHIAVAQRIDALVIAPATANTLAQLAHGLSSDLLGTIYLATRAPVVLAPAMNVNMWKHPATEANLRLLEARGATVVPPEEGDLACGMTGSGRLAEPVRIAERVVDLLARPQDMAAETVLVTAGGTREPIDPVRFLGNRSSGKMGHALAEAALARGARVVLVTAAATAPALPCEIVRVETAEQMRGAVLERLAEATMVIKAAAVSDYRVRTPATEKLKRSGPLTLELEPTEDIAAEVVRRRAPGTLVVAFAAETSRMHEEARRKLIAKGVDAIVANDVARPGCGFDAERNAGTWLTRESETSLPESSKREMADAILDGVLRLRTAKRRAVTPADEAAGVRSFESHLT